MIDRVPGEDMWNCMSMPVVAEKCVWVVQDMYNRWKGEAEVANVDEFKYLGSKQWIVCKKTEEESEQEALEDCSETCCDVWF